MTLQEVRAMIATRLKDAGIEAFEYETWVFLDWKLGVNRADFFMDSGKEISDSHVKELEKVLSMREKRVPLQYIMKESDFMGFPFYVDERVLIPRHDTECLVEECLGFLSTKIREGIKPRVLDLCTGSGCIGISLKLLCPESRVVLADLSEDAIEVAARNKDALSADVTIVRGDLYQALFNLPDEDRKFDLIVSNPPYIPSEEVKKLMPEVKDFEPHMALDGTEDGLAFYRKITKDAPLYLNPKGGLYYEIGMEQGADVSGMLMENGFSNIAVVKDLAGLDRIVKGSLL